MLCLEQSLYPITHPNVGWVLAPRTCKAPWSMLLSAIVASAARAACRSRQAPAISSQLHVQQGMARMHVSGHPENLDIALGSAMGSQLQQGIGT
eukprot:1143942-Pelagomonas_calceolata.AAC.2